MNEDVIQHEPVHEPINERMKIDQNKNDRAIIQPRISGLWFFTILHFVLFILMVGLSVYFYRLDYLSREEDKKDEQQSKIKHYADFQQSFDTINQNINLLQDQDRQVLINIDTLKSETLVQQKKTQEKMESVYQRIMALSVIDRTDWLLAEIEHFTKLAHERIVLTHDARGAISLLNHSDQIAAEIEEYGIESVRIALQKNMRDLGVATEIDTQGLFFKIGSLIELIEALSFIDFVDKSRLAENNQPKSAFLLNNVPSDLPHDFESRVRYMLNSIYTFVTQKLVRIYRVEAQVDPILPPATQLFLKQNLRLLLEQSQLAVLRGEQKHFDWCIDQASKWIVAYFPSHQPRVKELVTTLETLKNNQISPSLPDVNDSLEAIHQFKNEWLERKAQRKQALVVKPLER